MRRRRWSPSDDDLLVRDGKLWGYARVARVGLNRTPAAARSRMRRLRKKFPGKVERIEREAAQEGLLA